MRIFSFQGSQIKWRDNVGKKVNTLMESCRKYDKSKNEILRAFTRTQSNVIVKFYECTKLKTWTNGRTYRHLIAVYRRALVDGDSVARLVAVQCCLSGDYGNPMADIAFIVSSKWSAKKCKKLIKAIDVVAILWPFAFESNRVIKILSASTQFSHWNIHISKDVEKNNWYMV